MKPIVVKNRTITFSGSDGSDDEWEKEQLARLKQHILDGKPFSCGSYPPPLEVPQDEAYEWAYLGISALLRFYRQYNWSPTPFYCKAVPNIENLKDFIKHHIDFMYEHRGKKKYLPSLKLMIDLHKELSKKKNLPKSKNGLQ
jgi:hypothetical protein